MEGQGELKFHPMSYSWEIVELGPEPLPFNQASILTCHVVKEYL